MPQGGFRSCLTTITPPLYIVDGSFKPLKRRNNPSGTLESNEVIVRNLIIGVVGACLLFAFGCGVESGEVSYTTPQDISDALSSEGLTCSVQESVNALSPEDEQALATLIQEKYTPTEFGAIISERDTGCNGTGGAPSFSQTKLGSGGMLVESIESSSWYTTTSASRIIYDSESLGWMCGYDPGQPTDRIFEYFYIPNAYVHHDNLRYDTQGTFGNCVWAAQGALGSRVYGDNSIRMCVGGTTYQYCSYIGTPSETSLKMRLTP
jgi:hypothetical protein